MCAIYLQEVGERIKTEIKEEEEFEEEGINSIVLNSTAEFCRTLGDIPTYGLAGNREEADQITDQLVSSLNFWLIR